jgi:hypothetical protein
MDAGRECDRVETQSAAHSPKFWNGDLPAARFP